MSNTTSRLSLTQPVGGDSPSALRTSITSNANTLDNAALVTEGTLANRPAASTVEHGRVYHATDTGQWFVGDGTNWNPIGFKRVSSVSQSATPAINTNTTDIASITGLSQAITSMSTNLTGTAEDGQTLVVRITDNGTAQAISWGTNFESSGSMALPTTTVAGVMLIVGFMWNVATSRWRCVAIA